MTEKHANPEDFDLYALGALDGEEKQAFEAHLDACSACQQELAAARERTMLLGFSAPPIAPPPSVKSALMQRVRLESAANAQQAITSQPRKRSLGLRLSLAFATAAAVLACGAVWLWKQDQQHQQDIQRLQAQLQSVQTQEAQNDATMQAVAAVVGAPDTIQATLSQQAGEPAGQAHVLYNARLGTIVYSGVIAPAPADKSYQLWLVPASGVPVNAGLIAGNQRNGVIVVHLQQGFSAKAFAVTLEPQGGKPQPTGPKVLVGVVTA
jgi:anti-sigma-K factor RskA